MSSLRSWLISLGADPLFTLKSNPPLRISQQVKDIFRARRPKRWSRFTVSTSTAKFRALGFFIDPTGTLYTAYTVGGEADNFTIEFNGKKYPARQLLAGYPAAERPMLKIDAVTPALPIGKSEELEVATPVVSIGYPLDLPKTPSFGMVAGFDRKYLGRYFSTTHLRLNLPTQRGEAGAPLLNMKGEVVGIVVSSPGKQFCVLCRCRSKRRRKSAAISSVSARPGTAGSGSMLPRRAEPVEGSRAEMTQIMDGSRRRPIPDQTGRHSAASGTNQSNSTGRCARTPRSLSPPATSSRSRGARGRQKLTFNVQAEIHPASERRLVTLPRPPDSPFRSTLEIPTSDDVTPSSSS